MVGCIYERGGDKKRNSSIAVASSTIVGRPLGHVDFNLLGLRGYYLGMFFSGS